MLRLGVTVFCVLLCIALPCLGYADECHQLEGDSKWQSGFAKVNSLIEKEDWTGALHEAEKMYAYCERAPVINYYLGKIWFKLNNRTKGLYFLQRATLYTEEFSVRGGLLERIWYERYEAEHPELSPAAVSKLREELDVTKGELSKFQMEKARKDEGKFEIYEAIRTEYGVMMWTGAGIGIGGLIFLGIGSGLLARGNMLEYGEKITVKGDYGAGWALLGIGLGASIAGAVMTGLAGYQYVRLGKEIPRDVSAVRVSLSPVSAGLKLEF